MSQWEMTFLQRQELEYARKAGLSAEQISLLGSGFNFLQMQEIRKALQAGMAEAEIRRYAHPWISNADMAEIFGCLQRHEPVPEPEEKPPAGRRHRSRILLIPLLAVPACMAAAIHPRADAAEPLALKLQEVTIPCGTVFDPSLYAEISDPSGDLILPPSFHAERPENRIALYQLNLNGHQYRKMLTVHVRDTEPPVLLLTSDSTKLLQGLPFAWQDFIKSAEDEVDGDLRMQVRCLDELLPQAGIQEIRYAVKDDAGNEVQAVLQVEVIDALKPAPSAVAAQPVQPAAAIPAAPVQAPVLQEAMQPAEQVTSETVTEISEEVLAGETAVEYQENP